MAYADLLVGVSPARPNTAILEVAADLARLFGSGVVGVAACRPVHALSVDYQIPSAIFAEDRRQIEKALRKAELEFRGALQERVKRLEWRARSTTSDIAALLAREGRSADLLILGVAGEGQFADPVRGVDLATLVMQSARPVLIVPPAPAPRPFERVLVAWKETREAQRAIAAALPVMTAAKQVTVAAISSRDGLADARSQTAEIALWLDHHGVKASSTAVESTGAHGRHVEALANDLQADLIVVGAHGYSRQREWVLGGVTAHLLANTIRCVLLSN